MINDFTPEQVADGRRTALTLLTAVTSDDDGAMTLAAALTRGADGHQVLAGAFSLLMEAVGELGQDLGEWAARRLDEAAVHLED